MSCDFGVWFPYRRLSIGEARALYARLCNGDTGAVEPHAAVRAFYAELTGKHPEIDTVPEDRLDDYDYCPWSCGLDYSPGHVILSCVWSKAEYVERLVHELARKHGLAVYDPQADHVTYPEESTGAQGRKKSRWRFWRS
ncbi:MAG TPA: hypothetical protein VF717_17940 [Pyrinomonadaceae bacterium]|jgi:hypothetical protein